MYAVVQTGGKQYRVAKNELITVEKLAGDKGSEIMLTDVLMIGDGDKITVGTPHIDGASVKAEVVEHKRSDKLIVFKKRRRQHSQSKRGHRQDLTVLRIKDITASGGGKSAAKTADTAEGKSGAKKEAAKKTAAMKPAAKKPAAKKTAAKKTATKKPAAKNTAAKKPAAKKTASKKSAAKKTPAKKTAAKKTAAKKPAAKKSAAKKTSSSAKSTKKKET